MPNEEPPFPPTKLVDDAQLETTLLKTVQLNPTKLKKHKKIKKSKK